MFNLKDSHNRYITWLWKKGKSHQRIFTVCAYKAKTMRQGTGASKKKQAEQRAAEQAMAYFNSLIAS